ncbi:MAG: glycosyltransferase [Pseudomonadota bacterium]|jgi:colanic acid/amylovoran biosynthesis glycosyltransferase
MHVAVFVATFPVASQTFVIRQIAGLLSAGHEVTVLTCRWGGACAHDTYVRYGIEARVRALRPRAATAGARARRIAGLLSGSAFRRGGPGRLAAALAALLHGSRRSVEDIAWAEARGHLGRYDAILAHFGPAGVRAMHLQRAALLEGPLAVAFHGVDMSRRQLLRQHRHGYRQLFECAGALLPVSELWRARLLEMGAPDSKITVLPMGVDLARLPPPAPWRPMHRPLRVLSVARMVEKKGLAYAIQGVMRTGQPVHYRIIGDGPLRGRLAALARQAPAGTHIELLGVRSEQEVAAALAWTDVFLLPSVTADNGDMEGIPVSLMEAMAAGIPVLASRHSGIPELVDHGVSGWLVPERDADAIARVLSSVAAGTEPVARIRRAARATIEARFDNTMLAGRLLDVLGRLARGQDAPSCRTSTAGDPRMDSVL